MKRKKSKQHSIFLLEVDDIVHITGEWEKLFVKIKKKKLIVICCLFL